MQVYRILKKKRRLLKCSCSSLKGNYGKSQFTESQFRFSDLRLERLTRVQWSWVQIQLRTTFYSYFKFQIILIYMSYQEVTGRFVITDRAHCLSF